MSTYIKSFLNKIQTALNSTSPTGATDPPDKSSTRPYYIYNHHASTWTLYDQPIRSYPTREKCYAATTDPYPRERTQQEISLAATRAATGLYANPNSTLIDPKCPGCDGCWRYGDCCLRGWLNELAE